MVKAGPLAPCSRGIRGGLTHPSAGSSQRGSIGQAVGAVVLHQLHQRAEARVGLHVEIVPVGLEDFKVFDVAA